MTPNQAGGSALFWIAVAAVCLGLSFWFGIRPDDVETDCDRFSTFAQDC
jgi:hypothetical protein